MENINKPIVIDKSIEQELTNSLTKLEETTGEQYQIILQKYGTMTNNDKIIKSFEQRSKYIISDMDERYRILNGTYASYQEIQDRLKLLCHKYGLKYENVMVSLHSGEVYTCDGGSISICTTIGKIKFE